MSISGPSSTRVSSRSPPSTPPVGFRTSSVAAPVPSRSTGSSAWRGSVKRRPVRTVRSARRAKARPRKPSRPVRGADDASGLEEELAANPVHHAVGAGSIAKVGEDEGSIAPHPLGVPLHHGEIGADVGREVDLVDDEQIGAGDAGPALARDLVPFGYVDDIDGRVHELRAEGGGEVVSSALHEEHLEGGEAAEQLVRRFEVDGGILADGRVWASARLHSHHPFRRQGASSDQELRVFLRIDVVGDHGDVVAIAQTQAERLDEGRLARAYGPADADAKRPGNPWVPAHERKSLISRVACRMPARSMPGAKLHRCWGRGPAASLATRAITGWSAHRTRCPSICPMERSRSAAPIRSAVVE